MKNEQFVVQTDAQKTFEAVLKGFRIEENPERGDNFIRWIDDNEEGTHTHDLLNQMFYDMRQSDIYAFKRISMKIQYEVLSIGLKQSIVDIS